MNDNIDDTSIKQPEALQPTPPNEQKVNESASSDATPVVEKGIPPVKPKKRLTKQQRTIGTAALVVIAVLAVVLFRATKFERVKYKCTQIAGLLSGSGDYFMLDTYDPETIPAHMQPEYEERAIEAIRYANKELGFGDSVYSEMIHTTAMMGRQSEENRKYKVSWTYHPNDGLEVTYTKK